MKAMKTDKEIANYRKGKLEFWFELADNKVYLPTVQDQDERLERLQVVMSATPRQAAVVKQQLATHMTNWQMHEYHEKINAEKRAKSSTRIQNTIIRAEAYIKYAKMRGLSKQHIQAVIDEIYK
jgi:hypothetical protein